MSNITARLDAVIEKRQPLVRQMQEVHTNLRSLKTIIEKLEYCRQTLRLSPDDTDTLAQVNKLNLSGFLKRINFQLQQLTKLKNRYDRGTIDIAVIGLMGQGKSTFLKAASGLSNEIIPARSGGGACTAVRSNIYHQPGETTAKVIFHTETSFLKEVILPYYQELKLGSSPNSLDEFAQSILPPLPKEASTTHRAVYERLSNEYKAHFNDYSTSLTGTTLDVSEETEIAQYVTHNENSFRHLAVKEVNIFCEFKHDEIARIGLKDLPGLGDLRVGDEKLMKETIGQEVDVVLFIRRPDPLRSSWDYQDTQLYETAKQALKALQDSIEQRGFMVLNHVSVPENQGDNKGDNKKLCEYHQQTIGKEHIKVAQCFITDCANRDAVNQLLDIILSYLAEDIGGLSRIERLDNNQTSQHQENLEKLSQELQEELNTAFYLLANYADDGDRFSRRFEEFDNNLTNALTELANHLKQGQENVDRDFNQQVAWVLKACQEDINIPDELQIEQERRKMGDKGAYTNVYNRYLVEIRAQLSQNFLWLNKGLKQSLDHLKQEITRTLYNEVNLGTLTPSGESEFIAEIVTLLTEQGSPLQLGFRTLLEAQISYEGLMLVELRQLSDKLLNPNKIQNLNFDEAEPAIAVKQTLEKQHQTFMADCQTILHQHLNQPSRVKYALTAEFLDQILYAKDMKEKWRNFLSKPEIRNQVWQEFQEFEKRKALQHEWRQLIKQGQTILEQPQALKFV